MAKRKTKSPTREAELLAACRAFLDSGVWIVRSQRGKFYECNHCEQPHEDPADLVHLPTCPVALAEAAVANAEAK